MFFKVTFADETTVPNTENRALFGNQGEQDHRGDLEDITDAFDRLFMLKPNMTPEEIENSRCCLEMIRQSLKGPDHGESVDWPVCTPHQAKQQKRKLQNRSHSQAPFENYNTSTDSHRGYPNKRPSKEV